MFQFLSDFHWRMFEDREPYKTTFKVLTFFGFWDEISLRHKRYALASFLGLVIPFVITINLSVLQANEFNEIVNRVSFVPLTIFVPHTILDFAHKKQKFRTFLDMMDLIELEYPDITTRLNQVCKFVTKVFVYVSFLEMLASLAYAMSPILIGDLVIPIKLPQLLQNNQFAYSALWIYEVAFQIYLAFIFLSIHQLLCSFPIVLFHIMQHLREKLAALKFDKQQPNDAKKELIKCVELHIHIKR